MGLAGWLLLTFLAASMGAVFMPGAWYASLIKPTWNPPNWIFGPVWSVLYIMMAIAAWRVWRARGWQGARFALQLFVAQLLVNALWSYCFFGLQKPFIALLDIILMWLLILATIVAFSRIKLLAAGLLVPYFLWVSFATFLNFTIWRLNS